MKKLLLILVAFVLVLAASCSSSMHSDTAKRGKRVITDCATFQ
ncbi:MAG: hypothetical protein ACKOXB_07225 [Flavobacteriales bacterium]